MKHKVTTKNILHQLGVSKRYIGYDYIIYGIELISEDESLMGDITKVLYIDIAKEYNTTYFCVERNIRYVIEKIWSNIGDDNLVLLSSIFCDRYTNEKPSTKVFFELLYDYVKQHDILNDLFMTDYSCPFYNGDCVVYSEIIKRLKEL